MQHSLFRQRQKRLCVFLENKSPTAYFFPHVARKNILFIWRQGPAEGLAAEAVAGAAGVVPGRFGAGNAARENQHRGKQGDKTHRGSPMWQFPPAAGETEPFGLALSINSTSGSPFGKKEKGGKSFSELSKIAQQNVLAFVKQSLSLQRYRHEQLSVFQRFAAI